MAGADRPPAAYLSANSRRNCHPAAALRRSERLPTTAWSPGPAWVQASGQHGRVSSGSAAWPRHGATEPTAASLRVGARGCVAQLARCWQAAPRHKAEARACPVRPA